MSREVSAIGIVLALAATAAGCAVLYDSDSLQFDAAAAPSDSVVDAGPDNSEQDTAVPETAVPDTGPPDTGVPVPSIVLVGGGDACTLSFSVNGTAPTCLTKGGMPSPCADGWSLSFDGQPNAWGSAHKWSFALVGAPSFVVQPTSATAASPSVSVDFDGDLCTDSANTSPFELEVTLRVDDGEPVVQRIDLSPASVPTCPATSVVCK